MLSGADNKHISSQLDLPLSTVQRRTRNLITSRIARSHFQIDINMLGFKIGLIHVYLSNGNIDEIAKKVFDIDRITLKFIWVIPIFLVMLFTNMAKYY